MRLSDVKIVERLAHKDRKKQIVITPMLNALQQIGPSSVDVHLGTQFMVVAHSDRLDFDPLMSPSEYNEWLRHLRPVNRYSVLERFILHPFQFALGRTLEFIALPRDIVGRIDGRSSWARQGLVVHSTAGDIHPGTRGFVVFELMNYGPVPIVLYPGLAIAQLRFETVEDVREDYSERTTSRYSGFRPNLWSGYPDDSVLRAMRELKGTWDERLHRPTSSQSVDPGPAEYRLFEPVSHQDLSAEARLVKHDSSVMQERDLLGEEFNRAVDYYQSHRQELLARFESKYVAIINEEVVDFDDDWRRLSERTYRKYGNMPLFMPFVSAEPEKPKYLGGPKEFSQ
jgi:dCTP deaminase